MAKIRDDLEGVVYLEIEGDRVMLRAGDTIPDGVEVGDHLVAVPSQSFPLGDPDDDWKVAELRAWAAVHDVDLDDATKKADILAAIELAKDARSAS